MLSSLSNQPWRCCITGKALTRNDNIVCFPMFVNEPHVFPRILSKDLRAFYDDPVVTCNENCALRSAFNEWEFKEMIAKKVRETWIATAPRPPYRNVLWEDDDYLVLHLLSDSNRVKIFFLKEIFVLSGRRSRWVTFCEQAKNEEISILLTHSKTSTRFTQVTDHVSILKRPIGKQADNPYQCIEITLEEWEKLKMIVCSQVLPLT